MFQKINRLMEKIQKEHFKSSVNLKQKVAIESATYKTLSQCQLKVNQKKLYPTRQK